MTALMARSAATAVRSIRRQGEPSHVAGALMLSRLANRYLCRHVFLSHTERATLRRAHFDLAGDNLGKKHAL